MFIVAVHKTHIPHDTLLLCYWCHIKSNAFDFTIRKKLFNMCQIKELNSNEYQKVIFIKSKIYLQILRNNV